jgi:hypothetical protein
MAHYGRNITAAFLFYLAAFQCSINAAGQEYFYAEGIKVMTGTYSKTYEVGYAFSDSIKLFLHDSIEKFANADSTILKTTEYYSYGSPRVYSTIRYLGKTKCDSIIRIFKDEKLFSVCFYEYDSIGRCVRAAEFEDEKLIAEWVYKYDQLGRLVFSSFTENSTVYYNNRSEYIYRDSLTSTGNVEIRTMIGEDKVPQERLLSVYDEANRLIKAIRYMPPDAEFPTTIRYCYDAKNNIKEEWISTGGDEVLSYEKRRHKNTACDKEKKKSLRAFTNSALSQERCFLNTKKL